MTSYNAMDVKFGYCGNCHDWTCKAHRYEGVDPRRKESRSLLE